jgi:hypothetical protein
MSIMLREGIKALSQLQIDANKDWQAYGVSDLKEVASGMVIGDLIARGSSILVRLPTGPDQYVLTSAGAGNIPVWRAPSSPLDPYFPVWLYSDKNAAVVPVVSTGLTLNGPTDTVEEQVLPDSSPQPTIPHAEDIVVPVTKDLVIPVTSPFTCQLFPDGAIALYGATPPSEHDETAEARSETTNDMHLPPQNANIPPDECYYFGLFTQFNEVNVYVTTKGTGNYALALTYWDGAAWSSLPVLIDNLDDFQSTGEKNASWTIPGDWALKNIGGYNLYWVRIACVSMVALSNPPLGQKAYLRMP